MQHLQRLILLSCLAMPLVLGGAEPADEAAAGRRLNFLLITVDDMSQDSVGVYGSKVPDVTPHIDRLASQGMRFVHSHVTIAICQPTRAVWMTGRYPHRSGALGFDRIRDGVPTLVEHLAAAGYHTGLMAKQNHIVPSRAHAWDEIVPGSRLENGRDPELYHARALVFLEQARSSGKPFFLMANAQDPHRPFAGSEQEARRKKRARRNSSGRRGGFPDVEKPYSVDEVTVPGFLPELPDIRKEIAEYYTSVRRADAVTGAVLKALEKSGLAGRTLVMFLSDHGMPLPFAKTNVWLHSTRTPWIIRWPGVVRPGTVDAVHMVSGIDLAPTVLDALGLAPLEGADGRSFVDVLRGGTQSARDLVFTHINTIASKRSYPMRSVQDRRFGYIYNAWADGKTVFRNESQSGLTFKAMQRAAAGNPAVAARVEHFVHRTKEEFHDYERDPDALHSLIDDPGHRHVVERFRALLRASMERTRDPALEGFVRYLKVRASSGSE